MSSDFCLRLRSDSVLRIWCQNPKTEALEVRFIKLQMRSLVIFVFTALSSSSLFAQEIDNYSSLFDTRDSSYTRISYDNDLFRGTDRWYTQGIGIDVYSWKLRENPINSILLQLKSSDRDRFGIEFRTHGCTPASIISYNILVGDRPYAGVFSLGMVQVSQQKDRKLRLTTKLELGMIGPAALGEETQTFIHKLTGSDLPLGWQFQIPNSPIINYNVRIERGPFFRLPKFIRYDLYSQAKLGTFHSNISGGLEFSLGRLNNPIATMDHRFSFYLYGQSSATLVGYDASLMGGIIDRSGYHLKYSEIKPLVLRQKVGLAFGAPHFSFRFEFAFLSKEIKAGLPHSWGGVRLTFY